MSGISPAKLGAGPIVVYQDGPGQYSRKFSTGSIAMSPQTTTFPVQRAVFQNYGSDGASLIRRGVEYRAPDVSDPVHPFAD